MSEDIETELKSEIERQINQIEQLTYQVSNQQNENLTLIKKNKLLKDQLTELDKVMEVQTLDLIGEISEMQKELIDITFGYSQVRSYYGSEVQDVSEVLIGGEFSNWERFPMIRISKGIFIYKTKVFGGYKHKFNFLVNGSTKTTTDDSQPLAHSAFENRLNSNYKYAIKTSNLNGPESFYQEFIEKMPEYLHPESKKKYLQQYELLDIQLGQLQTQITTLDFEKAEQLEQQEEETKIELFKNSLMRNKNLFEQAKLLDKIMDYANAAQEQILIDKTQEQLSQVRKEYESIFCIIHEIFAGRYIRNNDPNPVHYIITGINKQVNEFILLRIYDQNGFLIIEYIQGDTYRIQINETTFLQNYQFLTPEEQSDFINDMRTNSNHILTLKYELVDIDGSKQCIPIETYPAGINFENDYEITSNYEGYPTSIINKSFGGIKTRAIRVGSEFNAIRSPTISIYTSNYSDTALNIFHIHLSDHSEKKQILQAVYIRDDQSIEDFEAWQDQNREISRYKIVIQQQKIIAVLYNGEKGVEKLYFNERKFSQGDRCLIQSINPHQLGEKSTNFELNRIPLGLIVGLNQENQIFQDQPLFKIHTGCRDNQYFDEWPGFLDVTTKSEEGCSSFLKDGRNFAIPACAFSDLDELQKQYDYWNR
ncbi:UNKNOWN [Stylonychia lemnae]|uniref:Uncharacterized protein n=1 Tax=Stylonychia lemnae TaxID=5949 RepID=A0A078B5M6_STYLE|nr:UNKNOWN [Stylonychia lemnae]|eukprot:CDW89825.1 UNKNOWN [Stylonychia lemnae]